MIIDVHTHVVPEKIAKVVLENLEQLSGLKAKGVNTIAGLKEHMKAAGADKSVVLALALEVRQVKRANDWLIENMDDALIGFGTIHPDDPARVAEVRRLRDNVIRGIKLHSGMHRYYPDDEKMFPVYEEAGEDMVVLFHAGKVGSEADIPYASPARIARVLALFPKMKVIAGHLGGMLMLDDAKKHLYGKNVYIETSCPPGLYVYPKETIMEIIRLHGVDRMLFGSDYAMGSQLEDIQYIMELPLSSREKERILGDNARELLEL